MMALGEQLGGPSRARAMLNGQGISLILKSIEINFRRPVTFPDNVGIISQYVFSPADSFRSC